STLATGRTGVRPETARVYAAMLSAGITPVVPEYGSLGCSGDLAPLSACALAATGEGMVRDASGELVPAADALAAAGITPVVLADGRVESNGNFHGAPLGYVLDFLAIAVADLASISERRTDRFLDVARSGGLPPFLADDPGVDSGHMIAQYTQAGIVAELK